MSYNLNKISTFIVSYAEQLGIPPYTIFETKNITTNIKHIISYYNQNKERVLRYEPQLESIFNAVISSIEINNFEKKTTYIMTEVSYVFLITNFVVFYKYDIIMYTSGKKKCITYKEKDKYVSEFQIIMKNVLKLHYFKCLDCEIEKTIDDDFESATQISSLLFEEFITQYLYKLVDEEIVLGGMLLELEAYLSSYGEDKDGILRLLELTENKIKEVKILIKTPPKIIE